MSVIGQARTSFHAKLLKGILTTNSQGVVSNADSSNTNSKAIAKGIAEILNVETLSERTAAQTSGKQFELICCEFLQETFL